MNQMPRRYLPPELQHAETGPDQRFGTPRPGFGTVYLDKGKRNDASHALVWQARWVDEFPEPDQDGAIVGITAIEGDRGEVLAWVRSRPAATFLVAAHLIAPESDMGFIPLPDGDDNLT